MAVDYWYDQPVGIARQKPIGYRPVLLEDFTSPTTMGIFPTGKKANQCQITIKDKLIEWLQMSAIEGICEIDHIKDYEDQVSTLLGMDIRVMWPG